MIVAQRAEQDEQDERYHDALPRGPGQAEPPGWRPGG